MTLAQLSIGHRRLGDSPLSRVMSPLGAALSGEHLKVLKIAQVLYERSADVDVLGHGERTLLDGASSSGHVEIVHWLLSRGANSNVRDKNEWTPLHWAACFGHIEGSRLLLEYNADICAHDDRGRTPLHMASLWDHVNIAQLLLERGADIDAEDNGGRTAFQVASKRGYDDIAKLLSDHGSKRYNIVLSLTQVFTGIPKRSRNLILKHWKGCSHCHGISLHSSVHQSSIAEDSVS
jgi:ankyrin repeat protein